MARRATTSPTEQSHLRANEERKPLGASARAKGFKRRQHRTSSKAGLLTHPSASGCREVLARAVRDMLTGIDGPFVYRVSFWIRSRPAFIDRGGFDAKEKLIRCVHERRDPAAALGPAAGAELRLILGPPSARSHGHLAQGGAATSPIRIFRRRTSTWSWSEGEANVLRAHAGAPNTCKTVSVDALR